MAIDIDRQLADFADPLFWPTSFPSAVELDQDLCCSSSSSSEFPRCRGRRRRNGERSFWSRETTNSVRGQPRSPQLSNWTRIFAPTSRRITSIFCRKIGMFSLRRNQPAVDRYQSPCAPGQMRQHVRSLIEKVRYTSNLKSLAELTMPVSSLMPPS
jgi:hypothetical protein